MSASDGSSFQYTASKERKRSVEGARLGSTDAQGPVVSGPAVDFAALASANKDNISLL